MNIYTLGALLLVSVGGLAFLVFLLVAGLKIINEHYDFLERETRESQIGEIK